MAIATNVPFTNTLTDPDSLVTLVPTGMLPGGSFEYKDLSGSNTGAKRATMAQKFPTSKKGGEEVRIATYWPRLETLGTADNGIVPPATVKDVGWVERIYHFPADYTPAERAALVRMDNDVNISDDAENLVLYGQKPR